MNGNHKKLNRVILRALCLAMAVAGLFAALKVARGTEIRGEKALKGYNYKLIEYRPVHPMPVEITGIRRIAEGQTQIWRTGDLLDTEISLKNVSQRPVVMVDISIFLVKGRIPNGEKIVRSRKMARWGEGCHDDRKYKCERKLLPGEVVRVKVGAIPARVRKFVSQVELEVADMAFESLRWGITRIAYEDGGEWRGGGEFVPLGDGMYIPLTKEQGKSADTIRSMLQKGLKGVLIADIRRTRGNAEADRMLGKGGAPSCSTAKSEAQKPTKASLAFGFASGAYNAPLQYPCSGLTGWFIPSPGYFHCFRPPNSTAWASCNSCLPQLYQTTSISTMGSHKAICGIVEVAGTNYTCKLDQTINCPVGADCEFYNHPCVQVFWSCEPCATFVNGIEYDCVTWSLWEPFEYCAYISGIQELDPCP